MRIIIILIITLFFIFIKKNYIEKLDFVPKIIWAYWDSNNLPELVQLCQKNWKKFAPNYDIRLINKEQAKKLVDLPTYWDKLKPFRQADVFRLKVLEKYGGVWMDASIILLNNPDNFINQNGLTLFTTPASNNENKIFENWFISCPANNDIIKKWWSEVDKALTNYKDYVKNSPEKNLVDVENPYYLVCHLALKNIYENNKDFFRDVKIYDCNETAFYEHKKLGWNNVGKKIFKDFTLDPNRLMVKFRGSDRRKFDCRDFPKILL